MATFSLRHVEGMGNDAGIVSARDIKEMLHAFSDGTSATVRTLIERGYDVTRVSEKDGCTALMHAIFYGKASPSLPGKVEVLLEAGLRADAADLLGETALHWLLKAAKESDPCIDTYTDVQVAQMETVRILAKYGANINQRASTSFMGDSPLHTACERICGHMIKALIAAGADVNVRNFEGYTPLFMAAGLGRHHVCRLLITAGARIDYATPAGATALMHAAVSGAVQSVEMLLQAGASIDAVDSGFRTAAFYAVKQGHESALSSLINAGANLAHVEYQGFNLLHIAVAQGCSYAVVNMLINAGVEVNPINVRMSPLMFATQRNDSAMVAMLLHAGANPHFISQPGFTPLRQAAILGGAATAVLDMLLQAGACVNDVEERAMGNVIAYTGLWSPAGVVERLMDEGTDITLIHAAHEKIRALVDAYLVTWHPRRQAQLQARWRRRHHAIRAWQSRYTSEACEDNSTETTGARIDAGASEDVPSSWDQGSNYGDEAYIWRGLGGLAASLPLPEARGGPPNFLWEYGGPTRVIQRR